MKRYNIVLVLTLVFALSLVSILTIPNVQAADPNDLVAYWKFDEGAGNIAHDETTNANDGTLSGGKFGGCLDFDGDNDYVIVDNDASLQVSTFTLEAWVYPRSFTNTWPRIIHKGNYEFDLSLFMGPDGLAVNIGTPDTAFYSNTGIVTLNEWQHVAVTCDGSKVVFYRNNVNVGEHIFSGTADPDTEPLYIGNRADLARGFDGLIDEVRITDYARTSFDLDNPPDDDTGTVGLWHFDEGSGQTVDDATLINDGRLGSTTGSDVNDPLWIAPGPTWIPHEAGYALCFDGVDDIVIIDNEENFDFDYDDAFSIEVWFMTDSDSCINIVSKYDNEAPHAGYQLIKHSSSYGNVLYFFLTNTYAMPGGNQIRCYGTTDVADGEWHYVVVTYDGSGSLSGVNIYLDGVPETLFSSADTVTSDTTNDLPLQISGREGTNYVFEGCIDEVRIWQCALSPEEVKRQSWGLVGEWLFESDCGITAYDTSGFGNHGTVIGTPIWRINEGKFGNALEFDGSNYVDLGLDVDNVLDDELTIEAWIYPHTMQKGGILSSDLTYNSPHKGFDFFLWDAYDPYGRVYLDFGNGAMLGRMWYTIPSMDWYNKWHHVAGTWDGSSMKLYVDGIESTQSYTGTYEDSNRPTLIGAISSSSVLYKYDGIIDEVRIWNKALVPITFTQTGLDDSTDEQLVVTISDPIPLKDKDLPFIMMVPSGTGIDYEFEETITGSSGEHFNLIDVECGTEPDGTAIAPTTITGNYFKCFNVSGSKYEYPATFCDDFEDEDNSDWTAVNGIWTIIDESGNKVLEQSQPYYIPGVRIAEDMIWSDFTITAKVKVTGTTWGRWGGLLLRVSDPGTAATAGTYYELYLQENGNLQLVKTESGTRVGKMAPHVGDFYDEWWNIKAEIVGGHIRGKAWEEGTIEPGGWIVDWIDPNPLPDGKIGLITFSNVADQPVLFDDICATGYRALSGWTINLYKNDAPYATTTTALDGSYIFTICEPGDFKIYEAVESGWTQSTPYDLEYHPFTAVNGDDDVENYDFVNFKNVDITVCKEDTEGDPIEGWKVYLDGDEQLTGSGGCYTWTVTELGTYTATEESRSGWTPQGDITHDFVITSGMEAQSYTFVNFKWITISGTKFFDVDGQGPIDTYDPRLSDWKIYLDDVNEQITDGNGEYSYVITEPGIYTVSEEEKLGCWEQTYPGTGTYTIDTSIVGWDISGDWILDFDYLGGHYIHDMIVTDNTFVGTGGYPSGGSYSITWTVTGTINGNDISMTIDYDSSSYYVDAIGTIAQDGTMSGTWSNPSQSGTWVTTYGEAIWGRTDLDFGNWLGGESWISTSSYCCFDKDEADGRQFRIIFTPDINNDPNLYKISATNPGQFYYNIFYSGEDIEDSFDITIPDDFELQGANPVHVYGSLGLDTYNKDCLAPIDDISYLFDIDISTDPITVEPIDPYNGFIYITIHCDYALKQTCGYEQHLYEDEDEIWRSHADMEGETIIEDLDDYTFCVSGPVNDCQTMQNRNEFKKIRGIAGYISGALEGDGVIISGPCSGTVTVYVDEDGYYGYSFFHKGKEADYTVHPDGYTAVTIQLKAGKFAEVNFP